MFKKLFGQNKVPTKTGDSTPKLDGQRWVKVFDLELSNMEDTPNYRLTHQLSVGSEIGNIVIADASISPRHATFMLQQEVVSLVDHGSSSGTFVNNVKIPAGKFIILEESDNIRIGDLEIKIRLGSEAVFEDELPSLPEEEDVPAVEPTKVLKLPELKEPVPVKVVEKPEVKKTPLKKVPVKKKSNFSFTNYTATNALLRVIAVICDLLLSYAIIILFMPFDEFRDGLQAVPDMLADILDLNWSYLWSSINEEYGYVGEMAREGFNFLSQTFHPGPIIIVFITLRLIATLIFGVSFSELILGISGGGNFIWARVGGVLRVLIGIFTGPILIFDLPAIVSKRTFKEFMTFTNTYISNRYLSYAGTLLYLPLLVCLVLLAPMFQGLELVSPIVVSDKVDQRMKIEQPEVLQASEGVVSMTSQYLKTGLSYNPSVVSVIPEFKFSGIRSKLTFKGGVSFFYRESSRRIRFELLKNFDLRGLLAIGLKGNLFLYDQYPEIQKFIHSTEIGNPAFNNKVTEKKQAAFEKEVIDLTKLSFSVGENSFLQIMEQKTPLLKSLIDFKSSLIGILDQKNSTQISFIKIGNVVFLKAHYLTQKPFDLLIPLVRGEGRVYKVEFDSKDKVSSVSSQFYKFLLQETNWIEFSAKPVGEVMTPFQVIDTFTVNFAKSDFSPTKAQSLYGYYYEKSAEVLKLDNTNEIKIWNESINSILRIIEEMDPGKAQVEGEDPKAKLLQNFKDLKNAFENRNFEYFGLSANTTI